MLGRDKCSSGACVLASLGRNTHFGVYRRQPLFRGSSPQDLFVPRMVSWYAEEGS